MITEVIKDGRYGPMRSLLQYDRYVLTLRCGHLWDYAGKYEGIPGQIDCIHEHDDRGLAVLDKISLFPDPDGLIRMEEEVLHERMLELRLGLQRRGFKA